LRARAHFRHAVAAFGSTRRAGIAAEDDPQLLALLAAGTPLCTLFGKSSVSQVTEVLRTTLDENLLMIEDSVRFLRQRGIRVVYDAEHFFDGFSEWRCLERRAAGWPGWCWSCAIPTAASVAHEDREHH
jgi:isopropylmalate/homocitrate/citramalate synthase